MRKSCDAKADSCEGSAKVPVMGCIAMLAAAAGCAASRLGLGLAAATGNAAAAAAMSSGSSLHGASLTKTTTRMYRESAQLVDFVCNACCRIPQTNLERRVGKNHSADRRDSLICYQWL